MWPSIHCGVALRSPQVHLLDEGRRALSDAPHHHPAWARAGAEVRNERTCWASGVSVAMSLPFVNGGSDAGAGDLSMAMMKCTTLNSTLTTPTLPMLSARSRKLKR